MREHTATKPLFDWLMAIAGQAQQLPLERMIDLLLGVTSIDDSFKSPLKDYFFGNDQAQADASSFTAHLKNLTAIRTALREHLFDGTTPLLVDFIDFIAENRATDTRITSLRHVGEDSASVRLLSAHGSKGLEFNHVFVINATDGMWGQKASGRTPQVIFPPHLRLRQYADDSNERLRLFFVAMTRAKEALHISYAD
jgi:DNA helicase-2/ATP-dependent DNA helicase PcrA